MKTALWCVAILVGIAFSSIPQASADNVSGRVVKVSAGARDDWFTGSILGRRDDGTYWIVFTTGAITPTSANRVLIAASAIERVNKVMIYTVDSGGTGSYLYYARPNTWVGMTTDW